jgi:hypothetical protein
MKARDRKIEARQYNSITLAVWASRSSASASGDDPRDRAVLLKQETKKGQWPAKGAGRSRRPHHVLTEHEHCAPGYAPKTWRDQVCSAYNSSRVIILAAYYR